MMKQKFYGMMDKYLMAAGIDLEEYAGLMEIVLKSIAMLTALECQSHFEYAWDSEPCCSEDLMHMRAHTPDLDDPQLESKMEELIKKRDERLYCLAGVQTERRDVHGE